MLDADPAAWGWNEDQCWTLARIAGIVRRRFGVDYTLKLERKTAENASSAAGRFFSDVADGAAAFVIVVVQCIG